METNWDDVAVIMLNEQYGSNSPQYREALAKWKKQKNGGNNNE